MPTDTIDAARDVWDTWGCQHGPGPACLDCTTKIAKARRKSEEAAYWKYDAPPALRRAHDRNERFFKATAALFWIGILIQTWIPMFAVILVWAAVAVIDVRRLSPIWRKRGE